MGAGGSVFLVTSDCRFFLLSVIVSNQGLDRLGSLGWENRGNLI